MMRRASPPWCRIGLAIALVLIGVSFITFAVLMYLEVFEEAVSVPLASHFSALLLYALFIRITEAIRLVQRAYKLTPYGLLIFGMLSLLPGAYHIQKAWRAAARGQWEDF